MKFKEVNEEVFYSNGDITCVTAKDIEFLKDKAMRNLKKKVRLCSHRGVADTLHEMLIIHARGTYVRPHKHINKSESFHIIEGLLDVIIFDDSGNITHVINMGEFSSGKIFYYRLSAFYYHTVIPQSDFVVFHETTNGPFKQEDTEFAAWAPCVNDHKSQLYYYIKSNASGRP